MTRLTSSLPDDPDALHETLLRHARLDGPSQRTRERIMAQVAAAAVVTTSAGLLATSAANHAATVSTAKFGALVAAKWALAGAVAATTVLGVREAVVRYDTVPASETRAAPAPDFRVARPGSAGERPHRMPVSAPTEGAISPSDEQPARAAREPASNAAATRPAPSPAPASKEGTGERTETAPIEPTPIPTPLAPAAPTVSSRTDATAQLSRELEFLERARARLALQSPIVALNALNDYERTFPAGAMKVEASALRVEALAAAGRRQEAAALARAFLAAYPENPMADRVRTVLLRLEAWPRRP